MVGRFLKMFSICVDFIKPWLYQKGRKSPNGKAIYGSQYRTRECFWLGKPCKNHQTVDFQPICNDPDVKICDTEVITVYEFRHYRRKFRRILFNRHERDHYSISVCDFTRSWTKWFQSGQYYIIYFISDLIIIG